MAFNEWLSAVDRIFMQVFVIDHEMGGFSNEEMHQDWSDGESPKEWVDRIGTKYDLQRWDNGGFR